MSGVKNLPFLALYKCHFGSPYSYRLFGPGPLPLHLSSSREGDHMRLLRLPFQAIAFCGLVVSLSQPLHAQLSGCDWIPNYVTVQCGTPGSSCDLQLPVTECGHGGAQGSGSCVIGSGYCSCTGQAYPDGNAEPLPDVCGAGTDYCSTCDLTQCSGDIYSAPGCCVTCYGSTPAPSSGATSLTDACSTFGFCYSISCPGYDPLICTPGALGPAPQPTFPPPPNPIPCYCGNCDPGCGYDCCGGGGGGGGGDGDGGCEEDDQCWVQ